MTTSPSVLELRYDIGTMVTSITFVPLLFLGLAWILLTATLTPIVLIAVALCLAELGCLSWHFLVDPTRLRVEENVVIAVWRSGTQRLWPLQQLRWRRSRAWHASYVGMRDFIDSQERIIFRIWPIMVGSQDLFRVVQKAD